MREAVGKGVVLVAWGEGVDWFWYYSGDASIGLNIHHFGYILC